MEIFNKDRKNDPKIKTAKSQTCKYIKNVMGLGKNILNTLVGGNLIFCLNFRIHYV